MTHEDRPGSLGLGFVIAGAVVGIAVSLAAGLLVAASLNTWLAIDWVRGIATLAAGILVAVAMLRVVAETARERMHLKRSNGPER